MFDTFLFKPIFNLLVAIYAIIPGHDFGLAIIVFTVLIRFAMWPLVKKQLHQTKAMKKMQPEIKELKKKHKGDRQAESVAMMELYKLHGVNPFGSIGVLLVQLPVFIALFSALRSLLINPENILDRTYGFIQRLPHMQTVVADISNFDTNFFNIVDTTLHAYNNGQIVVGAMVISILAGVFQYFQTKQISPNDENHKSVRQILSESKTGKEPDMAELNAATARRMMLFMPLLIVVIAASSPAGLAIYFAAGGLIGFIQYRHILRQDAEEMHDMKMTTTVKTSKGTKKKATPNRKKRGG